MKLSASFVLILASLTNITLGATLGGLMVPRAADDSTDDCANLGGPMPKSNLPDGVIASDVRKCAAHPLGGGDKDKSPKACQTESDGGCSKGYCWKVCGDNGQWCWTAENGGYGSWIQCASYKDCNKSQSCGVGGPYGGCSC